MFANKAIKFIGLGWTGFILENVVMSHNRDWIISEFGDHKYHMTYNVLSTAACSSILYGYIKHGRKSGPLVPCKGIPGIVASLVLQTIGFGIISQQLPKLQMPVGVKSETKPEATNNAINTTGGSALFVRCPMDFRPPDVPADGVYGTMKISRHAAFWSFGMVCAGEALTTVFLPEVVMFSFPIVFALIGSEHQDYRYRRNSGGSLTPEFERITSNIPFMALLRGKQSWSELYNEIKWTNASVGVSIALAFALRNLRRLK